MAKVNIKPFTPDDVVASILTFLPAKFDNNPQLIHKTLANLKLRKEYADLLKDIDFINHYSNPYSPLLSRIFNRLQESRLLASLNPSYDTYLMDKESKKVIRHGILNKKLKNHRKELQNIANELTKVLSN